MLGNRYTVTRVTHGDSAAPPEVSSRSRSSMSDDEDADFDDDFDDDDAFSYEDEDFVTAVRKEAHLALSRLF